jgi:hypothetical protein
MPLADTARAIGAVSSLLRDHLDSEIPGAEVTVEKIEAAAAAAPNAPVEKMLNLFLYEAMLDPHLKNLSLDQGRPPPVWLVLKYLMTAFDDTGKSDTIDAHECLGEGIRALQGLSFLPLPNSFVPVLGDNPEVLKVTFDETRSDLLSRLMQGNDEKYRLSVGFEVRPVMIATDEAPTFSLLVGVDYTQDPNEEIGEDGIRIPVLPSMGPQLAEVTPTKIEADPDPQLHAVLTLSGSDLNLPGLAVELGPAELEITAQQPNELRCRVDGDIAGGRTISAGSHPLSAVQTLPTGRRRSSNVLVANLLPKLTEAKFTASSTSGERGTVTLEGVLLGRKRDDILVAFYQDGRVVRMFDEVEVVPPTPATDPEQTRLKLTLTTDDVQPQPGKYRVILRVNGQQAKASPEVVIP